MDAKFTRKLISVGDSLGIVIPKEEIGSHKAGDLVRVTIGWVENGDAQ